MTGSKIIFTYLRPMILSLSLSAITFIGFIIIEIKRRRWLVDCLANSSGKSPTTTFLQNVATEWRRQGGSRSSF